MKRKRILICLSAVLFLSALGLTVYPLVSNYVNDKYQSLVRTEYAGQIESTDVAAIADAKEAAQAYNESLSPLRYNRDAVQSASENYDSFLNLNGSGIMGYVEILKLDLNLPIYHGTGETTLEKGVGHLLGSSLPIGGSGCHCILTGHSGVAGNKLFSDIDQLKEGDVFFLQVLNETLAYEVEAVNTVLPYETELLAPIRDRDLCTLVTCYPFGVNTHRLLVRGKRIPYEEAVEIEQTIEEEPVRSTWKEQYYRGLAIGGAAAIGALLIVWLVSFVLKKRRRK